MGSPRRAGLALGCAALLAACASLPPPPVAAPDAGDVVFAASGRLSVRSPREAVVAKFEWEHAPEADTIDLATPLGATLARLERDGAGAAIAFADGRVERAPSVEALAERALGAPLPVAGLAWWLRGVPRPGDDASVERDRFGRPAVLRQHGWEIVFDYADERAPRATRLVLTYPDIEVRLVIDAWK